LAYNIIMRYPNFAREKALIAQGYQNIVGIDEVGRGAWAGPIIAVAAMTNSKFQVISNKQISNHKFQNPKRFKIRDSKLLSERQRERIFEEVSQKVVWSIGVVTHQEIDQWGMGRANILVFKRALKNLGARADYLLLDRVSGFKHHLPFELITGGDRKVLSIAIASILAKVTRDRLMRKYHQKYPHYNFDRHKGYGTARHRQCLKEHGICEIHRRSYRPITHYL